MGSEIPRVVRQQRWSSMNVPLIWAVAGGEDRTPVLEWLMSLLSQSTEVLEFHEGNIAAEVAVQTGWSALRTVFLTWSFMDREGLTEWLRSQGFAGSQPRNHIPARAREFILEQACRQDARVALLESAYVAAADSWGCEQQTQRLPRHTEGCTNVTTGCRPIVGNNWIPWT